MKLIKPSFEILPQSEGLDGIYKQIELAGRTCYKSEDKITEDSAKGFVDRMIKSGHGAMLEHGTVYLKFEMDYEGIERCDKYYHTMPYSECCDYHKFYYITTNLRVLVENGWLDDLKYLCEPTEYHEKRITVKFITDQGILREFTRHRVFSFAVESTRYCNYNGSKFNNEITYILPCWINEEEISSYGPYHTVCRSKTPESVFIAILNNAEQDYKSLIDMGWKPQQARNVLSLATKCEMIMTGFASDWEHFFFLRTPVNAHPQARELAIPLKEEFIKRNLI